MKIHFKKKDVNLNLILGLLWLSNAIVQVTYNENPKWYDYVWFLFSGFYLMIYFYQKKSTYLTIENGIIKHNWPIGKTMDLVEIKKVKHFAGEYILTSEKKKMTIDIQLVDEKSLSNLKTELKKLTVEWS